LFAIVPSKGPRTPEVLTDKPALSPNILIIVPKRKAGTAESNSDKRLRAEESVRGRDKRLFVSPQRSVRHWGPISLLSCGYWGLFPRDVKLATHLHECVELSVYQGVYLSRL
jgi:hypothetical protein